jgi:hypothetical protein
VNAKNVKRHGKKGDRNKAKNHIQFEKYREFCAVIWI